MYPSYFFWHETFGCLVNKSAPFRRAWERMDHLPGGDTIPDLFANEQYCLNLLPLNESIKRTIERGPFFKLSHKLSLCKMSKKGQGAKVVTTPGFFHIPGSILSFFVGGLN